MADLILIVHFSIVIFVTASFALVPVGCILGWEWPKNKKFRVIHLGLIVIITLETFIGMTCPLTALENSLRDEGESRTFIGYWVNELIYWDLNVTFFIALYFAIIYTLMVYAYTSSTTHRNSILADK